MNDLWENLILEDENFLAPKEYLENQSKLLLDKTKKLLYLEIDEYQPAVYTEDIPSKDFFNVLPKVAYGEEISYYREILNFKVSLKSNSVEYEYGVLTFKHDILGYPVDVSLNPDISIDGGLLLKKLENFSEFRNAMNEVFSTDKIKNVIKSMYSMSKK